MISEVALEEFKEIWKKEFGDNISDDLAMEEAMNLLTLFEVTYKPLKKEELDKYENEYKQHKNTC